MKVCIDPPVIAHRGASAYAPENTMMAFIKAAQLGVRWIEFDVMSAACGQPIIFHDEKLDRTTNGHGTVNQFSYQYLSTLDAGIWFSPTFSGERILLLASVIDFLREMHMSANIEIKALPGQEVTLVQRILTEINQKMSLTSGHILFSSFSIPALRVLRKYSPECLMGLLLDEWQPDWQVICESLRCVSIHVNHKILTPTYAHEIKKMGKLLLCYTVNDAALAQKLFSWGVDAVFSDIPDKIYPLGEGQNDL